MDQVFQKTRELGEALLSSDAYLRMKAAEEKAMKNEEAARMMGEMLEKRAEVAQLMRDPNPDPGALKRISEEMDRLQEQISLIDDITELTAARTDFNGLINQINQVLQFIVTGRIENDDSCSGDCSACPGCH